MRSLGELRELNKLQNYEQAILRKQFKTAKKEAVKAANELYAVEFFPEFNSEVVRRLNAVILPDNFDMSAYTQGIRQIGLIMAKAADTFDWNSPLLDLIPDVL